MATIAATPEVFVRKSSGLVRVMSPSSAFIYNVLTMGLIFPWTYLWAPGALPGGQIVWGILLAVVLEIPIALAYVWLSTALPRSGGDYVFQSRVLGGGIAFTLVMSGFVIWILQWVALSGWLLSYLGFAALFLGLGATLGNAMFLDWAGWFASDGIVPVSIINAFVALVVLTSGFKNYVRLQQVMWVSVLIAFGTMLVVLGTTAAIGRRGPDQRLLDRHRWLGDLLRGRRRRGGRGRLQPEPAVQPAGHPADRPDRLDVAPVGDLQLAAERRDQGRSSRSEARRRSSSGRSS